MLSVFAGCVGMPAIETTIPEPPPFSESGEVQPAEEWWLEFGDARLDEKINEAFAGNYDIAAAWQSVAAARALTMRLRSDLYPDLDGVSSFSSSAGPGDGQTTYQIGLDAGYQVDLWGEIRSRVEAQYLRANATRFNTQTIGLSLSAEVARTWFSLIEAKAQMDLLEEQIQTNKTGLKVQESRFGLGLSRSSADVLRQRQLLESTYEQAVVAEARFQLLEHQLAVLLGQMPQSASFDAGTILPELPPLPDTGFPIELLHRRPDVQRDYMAFLAADRDLATAISQQYPRLNLSAGLINSAGNSESFLRDWFISIASQVAAPLFDGGQRKSEIDRTTAVRCQEFNQYMQSVILAFQEVEDNLALEKYQRLQIKRIDNQLKLAKESTDILRERLATEDAEYLDVLSATTGQQRLERQLLSAQLELRLIRISLYLALAGGFDPVGQIDVPESNAPIANLETGLEVDSREVNQPQDN